MVSEQFEVFVASWFVASCMASVGQFHVLQLMHVSTSSKLVASYLAMSETSYPQLRTLTFTS